MQIEITASIIALYYVKVKYIGLQMKCESATKIRRNSL